MAINAAHQSNRTIWISRQIIREYLVTMTRPQTFENLAKAIVLEQIEQFTARFEVADDIPAVTEKLLALLANYPLGGQASA
jgi:hypothetical protein